MNIWQPEHPHHAVWRECTQSLLDGKPKVVEARDPNSLYTAAQKWHPTADPKFLAHMEYRIARPMLTVSYTVPMPVKEPLLDRQKFWTCGGLCPLQFTWNKLENGVQEAWLREGRIYLTREDAQAAIDARNAGYEEALK